MVEVLPSLSNMVLQLTAHKKDRTQYQLQPDSLVGRSDMLPAAALSNFFRAPASSIHNKLPAIAALPSDKPPQFSKSINQRNRCLAEVIQTQLLELKKLQDRYRYKNTDLLPSRQRQHQHRCSLDEGQLMAAKGSGSGRRKSVSQPKPSSKSDITPQAISADIRVLTLPVAATSKPYKPVGVKVETKEMKASVQPISHTGNALIAQFNNYMVEKPRYLVPETLIQRHMDPLKFAAIQKWVNSVETAHKMEGKCSEVISTPAVDS